MSRLACMHACVAGSVSSTAILACFVSSTLQRLPSIRLLSLAATVMLLSLSLCNIYLCPSVYVGNAGLWQSFQA